jgi:hypothetical protein
MIYDPNGGVLHDLAATLTRWGVGDGPDLTNLYDMVMVVGESANREYGAKVDIGALAHAAVFAFPAGFTREEIQANLDRIVEAFS